MQKGEGSTLIQEHLPRGEDLNDALQGESDGSQPSDRQTDDTEAPDDFGSIFGNPIIYRHHAAPRV